MRIAEITQTIIHKLELGIGAKFLRWLLLALAIFLLVILYDSCAYKNMSTPEGMDAAQLARNISEGKGYTTQFIRPLSLYLVQTRNESRGALSLTATNFDFAEVKTAHPDLANPPVYPVLLAGLMKILPFRYDIDLKHSFWSDNGRFTRYQPDFLIAIFNQILLLAAVVIVFFIARKLFDPTVAWLSAILTIGCEELWRFTTSGLSTIFLLLIFLALVWCIIKIEELARETAPPAKHLLRWVIAAGALAGLGALTRYAFGWVILPVMIFLFFFSGQRKLFHTLIVFAVFAVILTPWVIRNYAISGMPFGTATFAAPENTLAYPHFQLERAIHPNLNAVFSPKPYLLKMMANIRTTLVDELPKLGGSWASTMFLAGLLLAFRNVAVRRARYFLLLCLGVFVIFQSLGRTGLSEENPGVNSENLIILLAPLVFVYGVSFFSTLLDQMELPVLQLRYSIMAAFVVLSCIQMIFALLPPKTNPVVYPPYYPPDIHESAGWLKPDEMEMSDVPWAVAWYGNRQCVWLSLNAEDDFFAINDNFKTVSALYLTPETMDGKFLTDWVRARDYSWGSFIIQSVLQNQLPPKFPLRAAPTGFLPERLYLTDFPRWKLAK